MQDQINNFLKLKGEVRGAVFQTDKNYVLFTKGEEGIEKLYKRMKKLKVQIPYEKTSALQWHPIGLRIISLLLIQDTFNMTDSEIKEMGLLAPKASFIVKMLMKFVVNMEKFVEKIPSYWQKHYSIGSIVIKKLDKKNKSLYLNVTELNTTPIFCTYLCGYFEKMLQFIQPNATFTEIKCMANGNKVHEFKATW